MSDNNLNATTKQAPHEALFSTLVERLQQLSPEQLDEFQRAAEQLGRDIREMQERVAKHPGQKDAILSGFLANLSKSELPRIP